MILAGVAYIERTSKQMKVQVTRHTNRGNVKARDIFIYTSIHQSNECLIKKKKKMLAGSLSYV